jgi:hypothetical protein
VVTERTHSLLVSILSTNRSGNLARPKSPGGEPKTCRNEGLAALLRLQ